MSFQSTSVMISPPVILLVALAVASTQGFAAVPAPGDTISQEKSRLSPPHRHESRPCRSVRILSPEEAVNLRPLEVRLVCGDPEVEEWSQVPPEQARFHLRPILETRGYFNFDMEIVDGVLVARTGERTHVSRLTEEGVPEDEEVDRYREPIGRPLTPALLDEIEEWMSWRMSALGYPCAEVTTRADPDTGVVQVIADDRGQRRVIDVLEEPLPELMPGVFRRYHAFVLDERFDARLIELTRRRIQRDGVALNVRYEPLCGPNDTIRLRQVSALGDPRLFLVGFGFDTEELFNFRTSWRNTRLGRSASTLEFSLYLSRRIQTLSALSQWYFLERPSRLHARPSLTVENALEARFSAITTSATFRMATSADSNHLRLEGEAGPSLNDSRTYAGIGPPSVQFLTLDTDFRLISHLFEYHEESPRDGYLLSLDTSFAQQGALSPVTAYRFGLDGSWLKNLGGYFPARAILGLRFRARSTFTPLRGEARSDLPVRYRYFIGGADDLRGFGRLSLPADDAGALTSLTTGVELRNNSLLPLGIQPLLFVDAGVLGLAPLDLNAPVFTSPGAGVRWESPVGVFRGSLAHGLVIGQGLFSPPADAGWNLYLSYGQEF